MPLDLTPDELALLNSILDQCIYALGTGARMPITREALATIRKDHFEKFGDSDGPLFRNADPGEQFLPPPGLPRWKGVKKDPDAKPPQPPLPGISRFILECCVALGEHAGAKARREGKRFISNEDIAAAYTDVKASNKNPDGGPIGGPGEWCE